VSGMAAEVALVCRWKQGHSDGVGDQNEAENGAAKSGNDSDSLDEEDSGWQLLESAAGPGHASHYFLPYPPVLLHDTTKLSA